MTLTVAVQGIDGIVLAADSRGTVGDPRGLTAMNDTQQKVFRLTQGVGLAISGAAELAVKIIDTLQPALRAAHVEDDADQVLNLAAQHIKQQYTSWFGQRAWTGPQQILDQRPPINFTLVGYSGDGENRKQRIYMLAHMLDFAPQLSATGSLLTGVPQYAIYLMHRLYDRNMTLGSLKALAAYLIDETASQDPKVGGPIKMAVITPNEGFAEVADTEIKEIQRANREQSDRLKQFFFDRGAGNG